jgi:hypothetical protein
MVVRRDTIGAYPSFTLLELDMNIPDEVMAHEAMIRLLLNATDMVILANVRSLLFPIACQFLIIISGHVFIQCRTGSRR